MSAGPRCFRKRAAALALFAVAMNGLAWPVWAASFGMSQARPQKTWTEREDGSDAPPRDPFRKECLVIHSASRPHVIDPRVYDHLISAVNSCSHMIKIQVCYFNTDHCIEMSIPSFDRKDSILGSYPALKMFRYSYREISAH